jgi:hypothetical protein
MKRHLEIILEFFSHGVCIHGLGCFMAAGFPQEPCPTGQSSN